MIYLYPIKQLGLMKIQLNRVRYEKVNKSAIAQRITFNQFLARVMGETGEQSRGGTFKFGRA